MPNHQNDIAFVQQIRQTISDRLSDPYFGVSELACAVQLHRSSLTRKLRKLTGQSPSELIESHRMKEARQLLMNSDLSIGQIAMETGFTELANFCRTFRRYYGTTPTNIRNDGH